MKCNLGRGDSNCELEKRTFNKDARNFFGCSSLVESLRVDYIKFMKAPASTDKPQLSTNLYSQLHVGGSSTLAMLLVVANESYKMTAAEVLTIWSQRRHLPFK